MDDLHFELRRLKNSTVIPLLFLFFATLLKILDYFFGVNLSYLGVHPLKTEGIIGIVMSALLHGDFAHLYANAVPLFLLGSGLFYYYRDLGLKVFILSWILSGALLWLFARGDAVHIGASGLIYALASFHLLSALLRRNRFLTGFALVVVFLYGSLIWGIFPAFDIKGNVSEEGHLMGLMAGVFLAFWYRKVELPWIEDQEDEIEEEEEEDNEMEPGTELNSGDPSQLSNNAKRIHINYTVKKGD